MFNKWFVRKGIHITFNVAEVKEGIGGKMPIYGIHLWGGPVEHRKLHDDFILRGSVDGEARVEPNGFFDLRLRVEESQMDSLLYRVGQTNKQLGAFRTAPAIQKAQRVQHA